jgi:hypothetical protein
MTTKELVHWAWLAECNREDSWNSKLGKYNRTMSQAAEATKPTNATEVELSIIVCWLYQCWNEVQDWYAELFNTAISD